MLREITATRTSHICDSCHQTIEVGSPAWLDTMFFAVDVPDEHEPSKSARVVFSTRHYRHRACADPRVWRDKTGRVQQEAETAVIQGQKSLT